MLEERSVMNLAYDGACSGRYSSEVVEALFQYRQLEREYSPRNLHRFNIKGFDADIDSDSVLRRWPGFVRFELRFLNTFGVGARHWLVDYGHTTLQTLGLILSAAEKEVVLATDELYRPWRSVIARAAAHEKIRLESVAVRPMIRADKPSALVSEVVQAMLRIRPRVLLLSAVTQEGIRIPVDEILARLFQTWPRDAGCLPLVVIDACQAFGRVPISLGEGMVPCAVIGCMHKAMRGPKEMGFLICSHGEWRRRLAEKRRLSASSADMFVYARTAGRCPDLPTIDCGRAVASAVAIDGIDIETTAERLRQARMSQLEFEWELRDSSWEIVGPRNPTWQCGIVLVRPPSHLRAASSRHGLKELLDPVAVDECGDYLRLAFDDSHVTRDAVELAQFLRKVADQLA